MIRKLMQSIREFKLFSLLSPLFVVLEVVMEVVIPILMAKLIDDGIDGSGGMDTVMHYGWILLVCCVLSLIFGALAGHFAAFASAGFARNLRHDMFYRVQGYSFSNIDKFSAASLVTRMTTDVTNVQNAYQMLIRVALRSPVMLIFSMAMAFHLSAKLALIYLAAIPVLGVGLYFIMTRVHPIFERVFKTYDKLNNVTQENLHGIRVVKSFVREDYEEKRFVAKAENITVGDMLDMWVEEELKPGTLSNGTVMAYQGTVGRIKRHPLGKRKLKTVTADHLQAFIDFMSYGGANPDGTTSPPMSRGYMLQFSAVLQNSFRFAVFPKRLITFNPMQYVKLRGRKQEADIFSEDMGDAAAVPTISCEQFRALEDFLKEKDNPALLPIQIAYYTGLRIGEVCALTWKDINLDEQYLTVRRSIRYNGARHKTEIGATKRKKIRTVDFCDTLAEILRTAKAEQHKNRFRYGELYSLNYYSEVKEKDRTYYEVYSLPRTEEVPEGYKEISFVCLRPDGAFESPSTVGIMCRAARKKVDGLEDFHFHQLRHTFTSNLLSNGAAPKDVQELLGHADVSTTMNIYAHATREAKRTSARLLDKVVGGE